MRQLGPDGARRLPREAAFLLPEHGTIPLFAQRLDFVFPSAVAVVGVLPVLMAYRAGAFLRGLLAGAIVCAVGWVLWGTGNLALAGARPMQTMAFALAAFLAVLLPLGMLGGAKRHSPQ